MAHAILIRMAIQRVMARITSFFFFFFAGGWGGGSGHNAIGVAKAS
jgi:hypothetical protein